MKRNRFRSRLRRIGTLALVGAGLCVPVASAGEVAQDPADVRQYWTDERMDNAMPGSDLLADAELPLLSDVDGLLGGGGEPQPRATATAISNPDRPRIRTHGKVFFTLRGAQYVCSGTVVRAENKSTVVTAGHCVYGFGGFATNWLFVPAKDGSSEPYDRWAAIQLRTTSQWQTSEDIRYDVGIARLERRMKQPIEKVVGGRKIAFNKGRNLKFKVFGYPAESPYNGQQLHRCLSAAEGTDSGPSPQPTRIDCDMTGGSSGGGWLLKRGYVNSVISYGYESICSLLIICSNPEEGKLFGPYFGDVIKQLYRSAQRR